MWTAAIEIHANSFFLEPAYGYSDSCLCECSLSGLDKGGSRILQGRVSNPFERGTGGRAPNALRGWGRRGCAPSPENFCTSYIKMVSFYAFPVMFVDTVGKLQTATKENSRIWVAKNQQLYFCRFCAYCSKSIQWKNWPSYLLRYCDYW